MYAYDDEDASHIEGGSVFPQFSSPQVVRNAVNNKTRADYPLSKEQRELDAKLAQFNMSIVNFNEKSCPVGPGSWITTQSAFADCEARMGMRWRTPEGWCYPESLCALDGVDEQTMKLTTFRKLELFKMLSSALMEANKPLVDAWLSKEAARLIKEKKKMTLTPSQLDKTNRVYIDLVVNGKIADAVEAPVIPYEQMGPSARQEFEEAVRERMPMKLRVLPTAVVMKDNLDINEKLKAVAKERKTEASSTKLQDLEEVLLASDVLAHSDDVREETKRFYKNAVECADAGIGRSFANAQAECGKKNDCKFYDFGDDTGVCMPEKLYERSNDWEREGAEEDPLALWFNDLLAERRTEGATKKTNASRMFSERTTRPSAFGRPMFGTTV